MTVDANSSRYLPRQSSKNYDLQFANSDRQDNYSTYIGQPMVNRYRS